MTLLDLRGNRRLLYRKSDTVEINRGSPNDHGTVHLSMGDTIRYWPTGADASDPDTKIYFEANGQVAIAADGARTPNAHIDLIDKSNIVGQYLATLPADQRHDWTIDEGFPYEFTLRWGVYSPDPAGDNQALHVIVDGFRTAGPYEMWLGDKRIWHQQFVYLDQDNEASPVTRWFRDGDVIKYHGDAARYPSNRKVYLEGWGGQQYAAKSSNGTNEINFAGQASWTISRASGWNSADGFHVRVTTDANNNVVDTISDPIICTIHYNP